MPVSHTIILDTTHDVLSNNIPYTLVSYLLGVISPEMCDFAHSQNRENRLSFHLTVEAGELLERHDQYKVALT